MSSEAPLSVLENPAPDPPAGPPTKKKPYKRSRNGCATCKSRAKKCDEQWNDDGHCHRCTSGGWDCTGRAAVPAPVPKRKSKAAPTPVRQPSASSPPPANAPDSDWFPHTSTSAQASSSAPLPDSSDYTAPIPPSAMASTSTALFSGPAGGSLGSWTGLGDLETFDAAWALTNVHDPLSNTFGAASNWNDFTFSTGLTPPAQAREESAPLTDAQTFPRLSPRVVSTPLETRSGSRSLWDRLPVSAFGAVDPRRGVVVTTTNDPRRRGVSLGEIYNIVVQSWLVGLSQVQKDAVRKTIDSRPAGPLRNVRFAVASAYIYLFAGSANSSYAQESAPRLAELARQGAGDLHTAEDARGHVKDCWVDSVSGPFSADADSVRWTEQAITSLTTAAPPTSARELAHLLWTVIDLQLVEFIRGGAIPSYTMLALGDSLVRHHFGTEPSLDLSRLLDPDTFSIRLFALSDISRCIVNRGQRTIFEFRYRDYMASGDSPTDSEASASEAEPWSCYLGLPDVLVVLVSETVNLCSAMPTLAPSSVQEQASEIETALRSWDERWRDVGGGDQSSTSRIARSIAGELWRQCGIVLLYQSVYRVGSFHPALRTARKELLNLLDSVSAVLRGGDLWGFTGLPAFLCAVLSMEDRDRERAMRHLLRIGPEKVVFDNIALVRAVWRRVDETGSSVDWHDVMRSEGLSCAFF